MAYLTGLLLIDAPASALNNAGSEEGAKTDNTIAVKRIRTRDGAYPYVSAQAFRFWLRTSLEHSGTDWKAAPVHRETKVAFAEGNPIVNWDDDLFGYMRAPSKKAEAGGTHQMMPVEKDREITRVSPLRVSTFVAVAPSPIVDDFGTMARHEGNPVPHEHQFYRAHLRGLLSLDLTSAGTFYDGERVGFKNLDSYRRDQGKERGLTEVTVRKQKALRLPLEERQKRVRTLVAGLANLNGGAKQALHYTDLTPAVVILAITRGGSHPFYRFFSSDDAQRTQLHVEAVKELLETYRDDFLSPIHVGWAQGFLDSERAKLIEATKNLDGLKVEAPVHPCLALEAIAKELGSDANAAWYD